MRVLLTWLWQALTAPEPQLVCGEALDVPPHAHSEFPLWGPELWRLVREMRSNHCPTATWRWRPSDGRRTTALVVVIADPSVAGDVDRALAGIVAAHARARS